MEREDAQKVLKNFMDQMRKDEDGFKVLREKFASAKTEDEKLDVLVDLVTKRDDLKALSPAGSDPQAITTVTITITITYSPSAY